MASYANPQSLNRYSYTLNNPILYNDPSGHNAISTCGGNSACMSYVKKNPIYIDSFDLSMGIKFTGKWDPKHKIAARQAVQDVGDNLMRHDEGSSAESAFRNVFKKGVNFTWGGEGATGPICTKVTSGGCTSGADVNQINFWSMSNDMVKNVVHELGHVFYHAVGDPMIGNSFSRDALIRNASYGGGEAYVWEQHPISMNKDRKDIPTELFADTFLAWTYDTWNSDPSISVALAVNSARNEMDRIASSIP